MAVTYLKRADKTPQTGTDETREIVQAMLAKIEAGGEDAAIAYGRELDGYHGDIVVPADAIAAAGDEISQQLKDDIRFAYDRVTTFAEAQKKSITEFETELSPGLWAGQKLIPIETAGCYVPGGRYAHVASAIMSIATARVAGVEHIVACTAPRGDAGPNPAILYAMDQCGADTILALGGVQGIAAMTFGLFTGKPARIPVGREHGEILAHKADACILARHARMLLRLRLQWWSCCGCSALVSTATQEGLKGSENRSRQPSGRDATWRETCHGGQRQGTQAGNAGRAAGRARKAGRAGGTLHQITSLTSPNYFTKLLH